MKSSSTTARAQRDLFWGQELKALTSQLKSFQFIPTLEPPQAATEWGGEVGLITRFLID